MPPTLNVPIRGWKKRTRIPPPCRVQNWNVKLSSIAPIRMRSLATSPAARGQNLSGKKLFLPLEIKAQSAAAKGLPAAIEICFSITWLGFPCSLFP